MADTLIDPADVQFHDAPGSISGSDVRVHGDDQPDMRVHDPETFAGLTTQRAIPILYQQSGQPSGETVQRIYEKALDTANDYRKSQALAGEQASIELQKRGIAVDSGLVTREEAAKAAIQQQKEQTQAQWGQGRSASIAAANQPGGAEAGEVARPSEQQQKESAAADEGFYALTRMHGLFDRMVQNTATSGGELRSGFGFLSPVTNATSGEARDYHSYVDFNLVGLAKAIQGDSATGASKDTIQAAMKEALPNDTDNVASGGHKIYNMMDTSYHKLLSMRNSMYGRQDTTDIDKTLVNMQTYMQSPDVQKYNPLNPQNQPVVQLGNSDQANAAIASVNAGANAGTTQMTPTGYVSGAGTAAGGPTAQTAISPQMAQHAAKVVQAQQLGQNIMSNIGKGAQTGWNWLQPFPTNAAGQVTWPANAFSPGQ